MDLFTDYANWKIEKYDLITTLKEIDSLVIVRYLNVLAVLDYLYDIVVEKKRKITEDEEYIFSIGFEYLDNNFKEMEECAKTVNLLLYTLDFEEELLNSVSDDDLTLQSDLKKLEDFEDSVDEYLKNRINVDEIMFVKLDDIVEKIFNKRRIEIHPIDSIFYEIAEEYNLIASEKDVYNDFINEMIANDKKSK